MNAYKVGTLTILAPNAVAAKKIQLAAGIDGELTRLIVPKRVTKVAA